MPGDRSASERAGHAVGAAALPRTAVAGHGLVRRRVIDRLEPSSDVRTCLLWGPQGSGKTTALAQWAAVTPSPVTILALTPDDGEQDCARVVEDAVARGARVLALDDADLLPAAVRTLQRALATGPTLRLVLAGRSLPAVDLARGELRTTVLNGDVLRFREHEVSALFREVYDLPLATVDVAQLSRHTDGWAAGLHLFHESVVNTTAAERHRAVDALSGRVTFARHYLRRQVLAELPADALEVLRYASPLEVLTSDRCRQLLGREVHHGLRGLDACTLVSSPDAGTTRIVHPLLRAHLVTDLCDELGDAAVDQLLVRAAELHVGDGDLGAAARALTRAHAWAALEDLVRSHGPRLWATREVAWVQDVPSPVVHGSASLRLTRAVLRLHEGRLCASEEDARAAATDGDGDASHAASAVAGSARVWLEGTHPAVEPCPEVRAALARPLDVLRNPGRRGIDSPDAVLGSVVAHLLRGDAAGAQEVAEQSRAQSALSDLVTRVLFGVLERPCRGQLECLARQARVDQRPWLARAVDLFDLARAYSDGRPESDPLLRRARECDDVGDPWGAALACGVRAAMLLLARQPDVAAFEELSDRLRRLDAPALEAWSRAGTALSAVLSDLPDADRDAEIAISFADACQLPAVQALGQVAAACASHTRRADRLALARAEAATVGFDVEPWIRLLDAPAALEAVRDSVPSLSIRCFGRFEIAIRGVEPALHRVRPRAREVLRLLSLQQGRPLHRELLLAALWPDLDTRAATHNLHVAVSTLRTCLEPGVPRGASSIVVRRGEHYLLVHPFDTVCDLTTFDRAVSEASTCRSAGDLPGAVAALERALERYRGDVLPEDGPAEWVVAVRDHYRMRAGDAAGNLAELLLDLDQHQAAVAAARRSIALSPWRDASWRTLQLACRTAGDLASAERARADYRSMLNGLGVTPRWAHTAVSTPPR